MQRDQMPVHRFKKYEELGLTSKDFEQNYRKSRILIEDLKIFAKHGILQEENVVGTYYLVNLEIEANIWKAFQTDALEDTINYAKINEIIHQEMAISSKLLEHVIGRIFSKLEQNFPQIKAMKIKLTKVNPPMKGEMKGVSIEMEKRMDN